MADPLPEWYDGSMDAIINYVVAQGFPTVTQLRQGILLGCIAEAVHCAADGGVREHVWDGDAYAQDIYQGERWAVAFTDTGAVTVFYSSESERNPHAPGSPPYNQAAYFRGMPAHLMAAKNRALGYMLEENPVAGGEGGVVTTAMWTDAERFTSCDSWPEVLEHSGYDCMNQLLPVNVALAEWRWYFDLDDEQLAVVCSLCERKLAAPDTTINVEPWEQSAMRLSRDFHTAAREAFAAVGIVLP